MISHTPKIRRVRLLDDLYECGTANAVVLRTINGQVQPDPDNPDIIGICDPLDTVLASLLAIEATGGLFYVPAGTCAYVTISDNPRPVSSMGSDVETSSFASVPDASSYNSDAWWEPISFGLCCMETSGSEQSEGSEGSEHSEHSEGSEVSGVSETSIHGCDCWIGLDGCHLTPQVSRQIPDCSKAWVAGPNGGGLCGPSGYSALVFDDAGHYMGYWDCGSHRYGYPDVTPAWHSPWGLPAPKGSWSWNGTTYGWDWTPG